MSARQAGVPLPDALRIWRALGLPQVDEGDHRYISGDVDALAAIVELQRNGLIEEEDVLAFARPVRQAAAKLARTQVGLLAGLDRVSDQLAEAADGAQVDAAAEEVLSRLEYVVRDAWR